MKMVNCAILGIVAALLTRCSIAPTAGGTTDTGNARVSAAIYNSEGGPAAGAAVVICPADYTSPLGNDSTEIREQYIRTLVTDDEGCFRIDTIAAGDYSIEVNDETTQAVLLLLTVPDTGSGTIEMADTLQRYAVVEGDAGRISDSTIQRYCVVYGLDRLVPVDREGDFRLDNLPEGDFHLSIVAEDTDWEPVEFDSVSAQSSDTVTVAVPDPVFSTRVLLNTSSEGAGISDDVYGFPVLIRLTEDNFPFSEASREGDDIRFMKPDSTPLPFTIESWDSAGGSALIWVGIDTIRGDDSTQYFQMLWGKTSGVAIDGNYTVFDTADGMIAGYHLDGTLEDMTVNGFDGIDSGSINVADGIIGNARSFNGSSQFFSISDLPDRPKCSFSVWLRPRKTFNAQSSPTQGIWGKYVSDSIDYSVSLRSTDYYTGLDTNVYGTLITKMEYADTGMYLSSTTTPFTAGVWYHLVWVWDEGSGSRLYVNGVLEDENAECVGVYGNVSEKIGCCRYDTKNIPYGPTLYFNGTLDEIRFERTCRSAAWVRLCYVNQRKEGGLVSVEKP